jgi:signal transduction histidine kinase
VLGTVLNVNDTESSRYLASQTLRMAGYHVIEAATGGEALSLLEAEQKPDLLVLDIKLPDMSGYDVCERIKANPKTANIAVIHTSATYVTAEKKVRGLKSGADVYLTQPFDPEELIATVNSVLRVRMLEQDARRRARQLEEADRRKDEFLAMLAHELRNPLAGITMAVELARQVDPASPKLGRMHDIIQRQARHLTRMVDDLLDVSRITRGKVELRPARVDLHAILGQVLTVIRPLAEKRRLTLQATPLDSRVWLSGDAHRLEQVFTNLLDNAVKYTDAGGHITLSTGEEMVNGQRHAVVRVKDTGIGIPPDMLARVFEPFTQADTTLDRKRGGLGIGLMLVHQLVELHGGSVTAASEGSGQGSELTVRLPLQLENDARVEQVQQAAHGSGRPRHILIVEDNPDARFTLHAMLEAWGHSVEVAQDGLDGVTKALQRGPELALVDIGLPGLDGYGVAERIRAKLGRTMHLVALSGYGTHEAKQRALQAGFDLHLTKPVSASELARVIANLAPVCSEQGERPPLAAASGS